jgi:MerR family transcriptional regulator, thiopeptide resistance regulator
MVKAMNQKTDQKLYQAGEFARRAGVSVRALHHYDRLGLLKPGGRTAAGYRLYASGDFARLQQVVTLKFIGFSLREIKRLLAGADLSTALQLQARTLEQKRRQLDQAVAAVTRAGRELAARGRLDWRVFAKIIEAIQMQTNNDWTKKYYDDEAQKLLAARKHHWTPELQARTQKQWTRLLEDIEKAATGGIDPDGRTGQALARRHTKLIEAFTGGHAPIARGLAKQWEDRANWPAEGRKQVFEQFARDGIAPAQGNSPSLLTERGSAFLRAALTAQWRRKYFDAAARKALAGRPDMASPEIQEQWKSLREAVEVAARKKLDPRGPKGRALARRHAEIVQQLTGGNASIQRGLKRMWDDRRNMQHEVLSDAGAKFMEAMLKAAKN